MRKTDISKYTDKIDVNKKETTSKSFLKGLLKLLLTIVAVIVCAGIIVAISLGIFVLKIAIEPTGIDLDARKLNQSSFIYVQDDDGEFYQYQTLYGTENRIWVDLNEIPKYMQDAVVAIEDKRFREHHGVDWGRTLSAIGSLLSGSDSYGGSTLTQQLIKNITDDNEVSLTRKLREIFRALNLEREYTKDEILESYLNVVNYGNNAQGVEAAANLYFDKPISECSLCECASIAGITQNPSRYNPLIYPENNKKRRELIIKEMYNQGFINKEEKESALKESEDLKFVGYDREDDTVTNDKIQNWYMDQMYGDLVRDLAKYYDLTEEAASEKLYTEGLNIYCAMDKNVQDMVEEKAMEFKEGYDSDLQTGVEMIDFDGRVIACAGSSNEKDANLLFDRSSDSVLQPGSSIKAVMAYPLAMDMDIISYGSLVLDDPLDDWRMNEYGQSVKGPNNAYGHYNGYMTVPEALAWSSNAAAVQTLKLVGVENAYDQATTNMGFTHLEESDGHDIGALSIGGMNGGVTVREMASAITYIGYNEDNEKDNYGKRFEPYTYYYVTDYSGNVILDNRDNDPIQEYSESTGYIMNKELQYNVQTSQHSASPYAAISGWDISGKTGTTDDDKDIWFVGASPYCAMAVWVGYDNPQTIPWTSLAAIEWHDIMAEYLEGRDYKDFTMPSSVTTATYCKGSGNLAANYCGASGTGYYPVGKLPSYCTGIHLAGTTTETSNETYVESSERQYFTSSPEHDITGGDDPSPDPPTDPPITEAPASEQTESISKPD